MPNKEEVRQQKLTDQERLEKAQETLDAWVQQSVEALERAVIEVTALGKRSNVPLQEARDTFVRAHNDVVLSPSPFAIESLQRKVERLREKVEALGA